MAGGVFTLDLAGMLGWAATRPSGPPAFGSYKVRATEHGAFFSEFHRWLEGMLQVERPRILVFEAPVIITGGMQNLDAARRGLGMASVADMTGHEAGIEIVREVNNQKVRKHFLGSARGRRDELKRKTIALCKHYGWAVKNDNEADALAVLDFTLNHFHMKSAKAGPLFSEATSL